MKTVKKIFKLVISAIVMLSALILASCVKTLQTTAWTGAVTASFNDEIPEDSCGIDIEPGTMRIEKTAFGGDIFAFVRIPLGVEFFANEITEAKLFLYAAQSEPPKELLIGTVNGRCTHRRSLRRKRL
jgi:hypothetical protein